MIKVVGVRTNFEPTSFEVPGPKGGTRVEPMYRMTAKGLSELAMSFSGEKARVIRIRFLNAFEEVADRLIRAEQTITQMLYDLERRKEKPAFAEERVTLQNLAQPALPLFH